MLDHDCVIWRRWLEQFAVPTDTMHYDVKVGQGMNPDPRMTQTIQNWAINITKKRIDVVVHRETEILIVEVTTRAGLRCIAQLVAYPILYNATFNPTQPIRPYLVAEKLLLDTEMLLKFLEIEYCLIEPPKEATDSPATALTEATEGLGSNQNEQTD